MESGSVKQPGTITVDNGCRVYGLSRPLQKSYRLKRPKVQKIYYCYSIFPSQERGSNENMNRILRGGGSPLERTLTR